MAASLCKSRLASAALRNTTSKTRTRTAAFACTIFVRGKATLPDLPCERSIHAQYRTNEVLNLLPLDDYGALEPAISGQIMQLHHSKHHNTYVNSYNDAVEKMSAADEKDDIAAKIALQPLINFHGGGNINHTLFWENLAPKNSGGGEPPSGELGKSIDLAYGSLDEMKKKFNTALAGIQGSGWAWLVKDTQTGALLIKTYAVCCLLTAKFLTSTAIVSRSRKAGFARLLSCRAAPNLLASPTVTDIDEIIG